MRAGVATGRRSSWARSAAVLFALALQGAAAAQFCPVVPCVSLFPCERLVCVDHQCVDVGVDCRDDDPCTVDSCDNDRGGCVHDPYCPDDGAVCNGSSECVVLPPPFSGVRCLPVPLDCDDGDACTVDGCLEPLGCIHRPVACDDGNPCTTDGCNPHTGCSHAPIAGCCRSGAECVSDACTFGRACVGNVCVGTATRRRCDDGDPCTADACDPATGCTATAIAGCCRRDGECPTDSDPCTVETCGEDHTCKPGSPPGLGAVRCVCDRALPAPCMNAKLPRTVRRRTARACASIERALSDAKRARRLVGRAAKLFTKAGRIGNASAVSPSCRDGLRALLADDASRAATVRDQL